MHKLNIKILGPASFISSLNELKTFLKFNPLFDNSKENPNIILFHINALMEKNQKDYIQSSSALKICAANNSVLEKNYDAIIKLPATIKEIAIILEKAVAKKKFYENSSLEIKNYLLNKNEKKLSNSNKFIFLTEKEIQLLELFLNNKKPISKDKILSSVWNYSSDADTHTVETHIYRLRKKISDTFMDEKFILNNKDGYYL